MFYNLHVSASTTTQGRSAISGSIMFFESFLANNVKFGSLNEIITFINNITSEHRQYSDRDVLDENISLQDSFFKVMASCGYYWIPTEKEMKIVWDIMARLTQEDLNRIYYKNNLYEFCNNASIGKALNYILQKLEMPFLDPNKPPKEIKVELDGFLDLLKEYVYYGYQIIDKMERVETMIRDTVLITDTDSCIVSFDPWYKFVLSKTYNTDMKIKRQLIDPIHYFKKDEFGDRELRNVIEKVEPRYDFDFYTDQVVEIQRSINPIKVIPQDGLRHSIINILAYSVGQLILDFMERFTVNYNSAAPDRKCLLIMKNEYLFKTILLTDGKKNYAALQEVQEGNIVPASASLAISGLPINKSGLKQETKDALQHILYEDILNSDNIDQLKVLKDLAVVERNIYDSLMNGEKKYYKPITVKSMSTYDNPMSIQGIKASVAYNALRDDHTEAIDLDKRNGLDIIKVNIDDKSIEMIRDKYPDKYSKAVELMKVKQFNCGIDTVALPSNAEVEPWILDFVDYTTIINDNLKNMPLDSLNIHRLDNSNINYTNIMKL